MRDVELGNLTPANIQQLKIINTATLPVRYSEKFYDDLLSVYKSEYIQLAFCNGFAVGGICARVEDHPEQISFKKLYIMTINVLAPYRRKGIGEHLVYCPFSWLIYVSFLICWKATKLLQHAIGEARKDNSICEVYLHVQLDNHEAKQFYEKHGFVVVETIKDYYKKIEPADCYLLRMQLN